MLFGKRGSSSSSQLRDSRNSPKIPPIHKPINDTGKGDGMRITSYDCCPPNHHCAHGKNMTAPRLIRAGPTLDPHIVEAASPARWSCMASMARLCTYDLTRASRVKRLYIDGRILKLHFRGQKFYLSKSELIITNAQRHPLRMPPTCPVRVVETSRRFSNVPKYGLPRVSGEDHYLGDWLALPSRKNTP